MAILREKRNHGTQVYACVRRYILAVGFENGEIQLLSSEGEKLHAIEKR